MVFVCCGHAARTHRLHPVVGVAAPAPPAPAPRFPLLPPSVCAAAVCPGRCLLKSRQICSPTARLASCCQAAASQPLTPTTSLPSPLPLPLPFSSPPIITVLVLVTDAHREHGLRHNDYHRYRFVPPWGTVPPPCPSLARTRNNHPSTYCSKRLHRLRKSLKFTNGKRHFSKKELTVEKLTDQKLLEIPLMLAERVSEPLPSHPPSPPLKPPTLPRLPSLPQTNHRHGAMPCS